MSELTAEQQEILTTFRRELTEEGIISGEEDTLGTHEDHVLLRFLRARKFNIKNAKTMIINCIKWRETVCGDGIDELYKRTDPYNYPERPETFKHWPIWYHKTDKKGRAINIESLGGINAAALYKAMTPERHWETVLANAESLTREVTPACSVAAGRVINDVLVIVDLKGFGIGKFWQVKNVIQESFQLSQDYYPDTLGHLVVINAPYTFSAIWAVVSHWLAKDMQEKVHILSSDYQSALLELIDAENLPTSLGGTCTCEGLGGCESSRASPWMLGREGPEGRRAKWLKGELPRAGLSLNEEEDVKLVREGYGNSGKASATGDVETRDIPVDGVKNTSSVEDVKAADRDVFVTEAPVAPDQAVTAH